MNEGGHILNIQREVSLREPLKNSLILMAFE